MKCKILITENEQWLVLKPESDFEEKALQLFDGQPNIWRGEFERCKAGYMRQWDAENREYDKDLIIKFPSKEPKNDQT